MRGSVAANFRTYDGRVMRVETLAAPNSLAPAFLFAPRPTYPVDVEALTAVRVFELSRSPLLDLCAQNRTSLEHLLGELAGRAAFLAERLRSVQFETLRERIAHFLLQRVAEAECQTVDIEMSWTRLSEVFGVARQSLSRSLTELRAEGVIELDGHRVEVLRPAVLAEMIKDKE